jgi:hypothetical protein
LDYSYRRAGVLRALDDLGRDARSSPGSDHVLALDGEEPAVDRLSRSTVDRVDRLAPFAHVESPEPTIRSINRRVRRDRLGVDEDPPGISAA